MSSENSLRAQVRAVVKTLGDFKRQDVYDAFPGLDPRTEIGPAFDSLVKVRSRDRCVVCIRRESKRDGAGGREWIAVYRYQERDGLAKEGSFSLPKAGSVNRGGERNRVHAEVQRTASGYEPGHFTALMTAHNWPPQFVSRWNIAAQRVGLLQTVQRRESDSATGTGWGSGTTVMPGTPGSARPAFMGRLPGVQA